MPERHLVLGHLPGEPVEGNESLRGGAVAPAHAPPLRLFPPQHVVEHFAHA
jgi:hypothetical protein